MNTSVDIDLKKLREELAQLSDEVSKIAGTVRRSMSKDGAEALSNVKDCAEDVQRKIKHQLHSVTDQIEEKPIASALTSFAVGVLLGMVFNGRRN